jgi:hypothetical protein
MMRKKPRYHWVRSFENNASPSAFNTIDLLGVWKTSMGITFNMPDITIWRIIIKIAVRFSVVTAATTNTGAFIALLVDDTTQVELTSLTHPYDEQYLMWDFGFVAQQSLASSDSSAIPANPLAYKEYDIRSHRKLRSVNDTLILTIGNSGNATLTDYTFVQNTLIRLP